MIKPAPIFDLTFKFINSEKKLQFRGSENSCYIMLQKLQGQSADWALRNGWAVEPFECTETEAINFLKDDPFYSVDVVLLEDVRGWNHCVKCTLDGVEKEHTPTPWFQVMAPMPAIQLASCRILSPNRLNLINMEFIVYQVIKEKTEIIRPMRGRVAEQTINVNTHVNVNIRRVIADSSEEAIMKFENATHYTRAEEKLDPICVKLEDLITIK